MLWKRLLKSKKKCDLCGKSLTRYVVRVKDSSTGKWRSKTVYTYKTAKNLEVKFKTDAIEGRLFDKKKRYGQIDFDSYIEYAKIHKKSWKDDLTRWRKHVKDNDYRTQSGITKILATMTKNGLAPATVDHVYKLIRRVYNWHIQNGYYFQSNPCKTVKPPKYDNKVTNYLSKSQLNELLGYLETWENIRASNVILFALFTGRRKSEILNLVWSDVDFVEQSITCRNTKSGRTLSFPLNNSAFGVLEKAFEMRISEYVFPSSTGSHYYHAFNVSWRKLKKRFGLEYRFHDLRHTYASYLASSGQVDIYTLKTLLGHQSISLTIRYAHLTNDSVRKANYVLDSMF